MTKKRETLDQYKKRIASAGGKASASKLSAPERHARAENAASARWTGKTAEERKAFMENVRAARPLRSSKVLTE